MWCYKYERLFNNDTEALLGLIIWAFVAHSRLLVEKSVNSLCGNNLNVLLLLLLLLLLFLSPQKQTVSCLFQSAPLTEASCLSLVQIGKKNKTGLCCCHESLPDLIIIVPLRHPEGEKAAKFDCFDGVAHTCMIRGDVGEWKWWNEEQQQGQWACRCLVSTWAWLTGGVWPVSNSSPTLTR